MADKGKDTGSIVVGHVNRTNATNERLSGKNRGVAPPDKYGIGRSGIQDTGIDSQHLVGKSDEEHKIQPGQYADLDEEE